MSVLNINAIPQKKLIAVILSIYSSIFPELWYLHVNFPIIYKENNLIERIFLCASFGFPVFAYSVFLNSAISKQALTEYNYTQFVLLASMMTFATFYMPGIMIHKKMIADPIVASLYVFLTIFALSYLTAITHSYLYRNSFKRKYDKRREKNFPSDPNAPSA